MNPNLVPPDPNRHSGRSETDGVEEKINVGARIVMRRDAPAPETVFFVSPLQSGLDVR